MSLEQAIKENTAAVLELVAIMKQASHAPKHSVPVVQEQEKPEPKPESKAKKPEPKKEEPKVEEVTFESLVPDYLKVVKKRGRDAAVELLAKYGVTKLSEVPAESLGDVAADIAAALED